ncbi:hypothetical protein BRY73_21010 [Ochrobactrum sp. P6BS-III]|nr:hypothetical protein BRY73_21010 [Ochrobactrum sp. P6BS-III]
MVQVWAELARDPGVEQDPARDVVSVPDEVLDWGRDVEPAPDDALDAGPAPFLHAEHCHREGAAPMD